MHNKNQLAIQFNGKIWPLAIILWSFYAVRMKTRLKVPLFSSQLAYIFLLLIIPLRCLLSLYEQFIATMAYLLSLFSPPPSARLWMVRAILCMQWPFLLPISIEQEFKPSLWGGIRINVSTLVIHSSIKCWRRG